MRLVWRLFLAGRVKSSESSGKLYRWNKRLKRDGLTASLRFGLRDALAPQIKLRKPLRRREQNGSEVDAGDLNQLFDWELVLAADHVRSHLGNEHWRTALPELLDELQQLLRDALDLLRELGAADDHTDRSYAYLPSMSAHWQNRGMHDWVVLIESLRDAWSGLHAVDSTRANRVALGWFDVPYPTFKRLALFAASRAGSIDPFQWVDWVVADDARWLWAPDTRRELLRLFVLRGALLQPQPRAALEGAILAGPPRPAGSTTMDQEWWPRRVDRAIWLRLAKLASSGSALGEAAASRLSALSSANAEWHLADDERDEFSSWMSGTGDPGFESSRQVDQAPRKRHELVAWLKRPQGAKRPFYDDNWRETCRRYFYRCARALVDLAEEDQWPAERWREALAVWSDGGLVVRSWRCLAEVIHRMSNEVLKAIEGSAMWWLDAVSKSPVASAHREDVLLDLCRRILMPPHVDERMDTEDLITQAINHPVGRITEALLNLWFRRRPNDGDRLPADLEPFFTQLCDTAVEPFRHGRVVLASHLIALFRVDRSWTEDHLLPRLDWQHAAVEARAAWVGFLWSPRLYAPLLQTFKAQLLETAYHYAELGESASQFVEFLTYAALESGQAYTSKELEAAVDAMPQDGLEKTARALVHALEGAGEQREDYWRNRILPFWRGIWPKHREATKPIAESFALLSVAAGGQFPEALGILAGWLQPIQHLDFVLQRLAEADLSRRFPSAALDLLDKIIANQSWLPDDLSKCLSAISEGDAQLALDPRYVRLAEYSRWRRG